MNDAHRSGEKAANTAAHKQAHNATRIYVRTSSAWRCGGGVLSAKSARFFKDRALCSFDGIEYLQLRTNVFSLDLELELFETEFKNECALPKHCRLLHFIHLTVAFFVLDAPWMRDSL
jgi:hypothetical protein